MKNNIKLFIGDKEVDFNATPDIFFNFTQEDLTNPTVVNNSFSKTISIEGTPRNNQIFGHFWNLDRVQRYGSSGVGVNFNPSRKTPFTLYMNGTLYESGYAKLDEVIRTGAKVTYNVSLYGGLGEFFYILSYDDQGNKLKLSDLTYMEGGDENEFNFTINKETIKEAWYDVTPLGSRAHKWHFINFAPCYNGIPSSNFSADKAIINFSGSPLDHSITQGGLSHTYKDANGYSLANLPEKVDEWAMRDIRSYMQRPIMSIDALFEGCKHWAARYGYTLDLDETFFGFEGYGGDNSYYRDAWFTLPMLNEIDISGVNNALAATATTSVNGVRTINGWQNSTYKLSFNPAYPVGTSKLNFDVNYRTYAPFPQKMTPISADTLYTSAIVDSWGPGRTRHFGAVVLQALCYDSTDLSSAKVIGGSDIKILTSKVGEDYIKWDEISRFYTPKWNADYSYSFGAFEPQGGYVYDWSGNIDFSLDVPANTQMIGIDVITTVNPIDDNTQTRRGLCYNATHIAYPIDETGSTYGQVNTVLLANDTAHTPFTGTTVSAYTSSQTAGYTGAQLTKKLLLSTEHTPAEYLLSYCKMFGLMFMKRPEDNVIHIMQRGTFYNDDENPENLGEYIDYDSDMDITPLAFDSNWYDMSLEMVKGDFSERYQNTFGRVFGSEKINTGYEFNADEKELMEGNVFRSAVEGLGKSKYYLAPVTYSNSANTPYITFQGMTYNLYEKASTSTGKDGSITVDALNIQSMVPAVSLGGEKYMDAFSKVQFCDADGKPAKGEGVLLFYRGNREIRNGNGKLVPYFLTDDIKEMATLNGNTPCWLYTSLENGTGYTGDTKIAIMTNSLPVFSRYVVYYGTYIMKSWDFGEPRQLFVPEYNSQQQSAIYNRFWKSYINDIYDVNTRVLRCSVVRDKFKPSPELFRKLYRFEDCYWRLNAITDWNIASYDAGVAEFVKVNDVNAYRSENVAEEHLTMTLELEQWEIAASGGTINGHLTISDKGPWWCETDPSVTFNPASGMGDMDITITIPANTTGSAKTIGFSFEFGDVGAYYSVLQYAGEASRFAVSPSSLSFNQTGGTQNISITDPDGEGFDVDGNSWMTFTPSGGTGTATVAVSASANPNVSARTGNIVVTSRTTGEVYPITVSQEAAEPAPPSYTCHLNITYGDVNAPEAGNWDYWLYYAETGAHPAGEGMAMAGIGGVLLYPGSPWNPSQAGSWEIFQPFSGDTYDTSGIDIPESLKGQTIYIQAELGNPELGYAVESQVVSVTIPSSGGEVSITIPQI